MKTRNTFTKLLALIIALSMVMSVASVALATCGCTRQTSIHVHIEGNAVPYVNEVEVELRKPVYTPILGIFLWYDYWTVQLEPNGGNNLWVTPDEGRYALDEIYKVYVNGTAVDVDSGTEAGGTINLWVTYNFDVSTKTIYSVTYTGKTNDCTNWPDDVSEVETAPTIAPAPARPGYTFDGWNPASLNWNSIAGTPGTPYYDSSSCTLVTPLYKSITVNGTFTRNEASKNVYEINYSVTGETDKVTGSYEAYQSGSSAFNAQALPTVAAGYSITGWNIGGTNYTSTLPWPSTPTSHVERLEQCDGKYVFVTYYYYTLNASANVAENAHETVNVYNLYYQISGTYTDLQGNTLSAGNMPNDKIGELHTAPTPSTQEPTMTGHSFVGWSTLDWGTPVHTSFFDSQADTTVDVYTYTATITGTFVRKTVVENDYYSLSYSISGTYTHPDGTALTPTAPGNVPDQLNSKPALVAGNELDGHTFDGWKQDGTALSVGSTPAYTQVGSAAYTVNDDNCFVVTKYFAAAVVGTYTYSGTTEINLWNLTYTGDSALADAGTWPENLPGETSEPSITTLVPAKLGYTFDGWTQNGSVVSSITWTSNVQYTLGTNNVYVKTTTKSATLNGTLTKKGSKTNEIYVVDYTVTGSSVDYNYLDVNETNPGTLPVIADNLHETGKVFSGWNPASLNWDSVIPVTTDYVYDDTVGLWVNTSTKTIDVSGSFGTVTHVYVYELTFTGPEGATLPAKLVSTGSAPSYSGQTASLANNRFDGWNPASLSEGGYVENTDRQDTSEDRLTVTHYMEASVEAQFVPVADAESYTLHYELTGSVDGQPANPADDGPSSAAIMPNNGNVPATVGNYYFTGWSAPSYAQVGEPVMETVDGVEVTTTYYEATVTGFYTDMHIVDNEISLYSLIYQGYVDGVVFWPGNVIGSETQPTLAGDPILNGYTFTGWTPAALDWGTATVSTSMQVVTPAEGEQNEPYLLRTTTYTITVTANFEATEIPTGTPEEIPLGTPGTGGAELIGFASVLAIIGMAILTTTIVRRRRNDSKDGE